MPTEIVFVAEEAPEGGYTARALGFSIFTEAETIETLHASVRDAVLCHFDAAERPRACGSPAATSDSEPGPSLSTT